MTVGEAASRSGPRTTESEVDLAVRARDLRKSFGTHEAVRGINLDVRRGEAFGILGRNGAGKTSTMRMIGCVSAPTSGELEVAGLDVRRDGSRIRERLGVCAQEDNLDVELTARQNLMTYARYFRIRRADARRRADRLLEFVELADRADDKVDELSGGMRRRLAIARALVNNPAVVLLDEPSTGLDPQARHLVWERLAQLKRTGTTLIVTTHYMDEAEQLCDRLVVMDEGRVIATGSPRELIEAHCTREVVELHFSDGTGLSAAPARLDGIGSRAEVVGDRVLLYTDDGDTVVPELYARGLTPSGVLVRRSGLEDVFLQLTGRAIGED